MASARWQVHRRVKPDLLEHLCQIRAMTPAELILNFQTQLHDPNLLPGMKAARALMVEAKRGNWPITIFGDYDADGTPAAALLATVLDRLGLKYNVIIPTRKEGYGLKVDDVDKIVANSKLLILVDTGITALEPITLLKTKGVAVIVLDHHLPAAVLPPIEALIDPFIPSSTYPFKELCGCALAYKFATALAADFPSELSEGFRKWLLDLVAISTVADMAEMKGENRVLVHFGLQVLRQTRRAGLKALMTTAGLDPDRLTASTLGYTLGPRLNATGRLGDNRPAFELLMSTDDSKALSLAAKIETSNVTRQGLVESVLDEAKDLLFKQNKRDDHCYIITGDNWLPGVIGLVAGKIASQFNRPTIIFSRLDEMLTGSARSHGDYSIIDGLTSLQEHLVRFGGHRQAAGLSLTAKALPRFIDGLKAHAQSNIPVSALAKIYQADAILVDAEITLGTTELCEKFQPFGVANYQPLFIITNTQLGLPRLIGAKNDHVKWQGRKNGIDLDIIGFGLADRVKTNRLETAHLLGHLEKNVWHDQTRLQLRLVDYQPIATEFELI